MTSLLLTIWRIVSDEAASKLQGLNEAVIRT